MKNQNQLKGVNILIAGSQKFEDASFVFQTLETLYNESNGNIRKVITSKFAGSCQFAKMWVEFKNETLPEGQKIELSEFVFDGFLDKKNVSLYDTLDIPDYAVQKSKFFQEGKEHLISKGINLVLSFPNPEGILGASTRNINRFAKLAEIKVFDCSELLEQIKAFQNAVIEKSKLASENETPIESEEKNSVKGLGFNNRHPNKR